MSRSLLDRTMYYFHYCSYFFAHCHVGWLVLCFMSPKRSDPKFDISIQYSTIIIRHQKMKPHIVVNCFILYLLFSCRPMSTILLLYYILRFFEISKLVDREPDQDIKLGPNMNWLFPSQAWIYYSTSFIGTLQTFRSQGKTCMKMGTHI